MNTCNLEKPIYQLQRMERKADEVLFSLLGSLDGLLNSPMNNKLECIRVQHQQLNGIILAFGESYHDHDL